MDLQIVVSMLLVLTVVNLIISVLCLRSLLRLRREANEWRAIQKCDAALMAACGPFSHGGQITLTGGAGGAARS